MKRPMSAAASYTYTSEPVWSGRDREVPEWDPVPSIPKTHMPHTAQVSQVTVFSGLHQKEMVIMMLIMSVLIVAALVTVVVLIVAVIVRVVVLIAAVIVTVVVRVVVVIVTVVVVIAAVIVAVVVVIVTGLVVVALLIALILMSGSISYNCCGHGG